MGEKLSKQRCLDTKKKTSTQGDQMRSCNRFSRVCTQQRARRGSSSVVSLTLWENLRHRVSTRTHRRSTTEESFTTPHKAPASRMLKASTGSHCRRGPGADVTHGFHSDSDPREADCDSHQRKTRADAKKSMVILFSPTPRIP